MTKIFLSIINMSISASYIVLAVFLLRLLLKRAPKWIAVVLWGVVAVRLICPVSIESILSLIPSAETVSPGIMTEQIPTINTGIPIVNNTLNPIIGGTFTPAPGESANPLQIWIPILTAVWLCGVAVLLVYTAISYLRVRRKIGTAVLLHSNIYQSENVISPFVLGVIKPKIYLPFRMNEQDMGYVIAHENAHIRRKDHLWKPLGFLLLTLHWFNPFVWLGYILLCRDIELACDEKVIKALDHDARADYSQALLTCSVNRRMIAACPLAFGEVGVKERVKSVLNYKKPAFWIIIGAIVVCIVVAVCFLTNPPQKDDDPPTGEVFTDYEGVYLVVESIEDISGGNKRFNVTMHNETDKRVNYGVTYSIQRKSGDDWVSVAIGPLNFVTVGFVLNPNSSTQMSFTTEKFDISEAGNYRLVVPFSIDEDNGYKDYKTWIEFRAGDIPTVESLKNKYPQFFDLNTESGLTVYVTTSGGAWYLVSRETNDKSYFSAGGASMVEMRVIVDSYNLDRERIYFDLLHKFNSSETNQKILESLTTKFWSVLLPEEVLPYYDSAVFDVDNDGVDEVCSLVLGNTSDTVSFITSFELRVREVGEIADEYCSKYYGRLYDVSFQEDEYGVVRLQASIFVSHIASGINQFLPEIHLFDITIVDGHIQLTEDGVPLSDFLKLF